VGQTAKTAKNRAHLKAPDLIKKKKFKMGKVTST